MTLQQLSPGDPLHMPIPIARRDSERFYAFWNRNKPDLEAVYDAQVERVDGPVTLRIYLSLPWINSLRRSSIAARLPTTHLTITHSPKIVEYQNVLAHNPLPQEDGVCKISFYLPSVHGLNRVIGCPPPRVKHFSRCRRSLGLRSVCGRCSAR